MTLPKVQLPDTRVASHRPQPPPVVEDVKPLKLPDIPLPIDIEPTFHDDLELNALLPGLVQGEPTALLLDTNNLFHSSKELGFRIDYAKLRNIFTNRCDLRACMAFSATDPNSADATKWVNFMTRSGYKLVTEPIKRHIDGRGRSVTKGNMDIPLTIAAMSLSPGFKHVIIGTCDGDFVPLVENLREGGMRTVSVLGMRAGSNNIAMSEALVESAKHFYNLYDMQKYISLPPRRTQ